MEKVKENLETLEKLNIVYHSIQLEIKKNDAGEYIYKKDFPGRFIKIPSTLPLYKNIKLKTKRIKNYNSSIIPMGESYNLIGIDIDNKDDTLDKYQELCNINDFDRITFTMKTMHDGYHEYYRLSEDQKLKLKDFASLDGKLFGLHIDIKYNNQILFGPGCIKEDNEYTYEILLDVQPTILPDFIFNEILKHVKPSKTVTRNPIIKKVLLKQNTDVDSENDQRLELYLNCLIIKRLEDYNEWIKIGYIIFNENGSCKLWDKISKKANNYENTCSNKWKTFKDTSDKKATIKDLIEIAKQDNYDQYKIALLKDKIGILDDIFHYGVNDLICAYLFYCLNPSSYIYDMTNNVWYKINEYGIFNIDYKNILLKHHINNSLLRTIEIEFMNRNRQITDEIMKTKLVVVYASIRKYLSCNNKKDGIIDELSLLYKQFDVFKKLNNVNDYIFAFDNGVYDLKTHEFRNAFPEELVTCTSGYKYETYDEEAMEELNVLLETIMPDPEELKYLLKTIALGLIGSNLLEEFYIWIGNGQNGKGVLRDLICYTLGEYFDNMEIEYLCKTSHQGHANAADSIMARKKDCRIVVTTEPEKDVNIRCAKLKQISGRDQVQVRELFQKSFNFVPKFKVIIQTNDEINIDGSDPAIIRRLRFIKFPNKFVDDPKLKTERKIDRSLKEKLKQCPKYRLAFFYILLNHYNDFVKNDNNCLNMPKRIKDDTASYIYDNDPITQFVNDKLEKTNSNADVISSSTLYKNFLEYNSDDNGNVTVKRFKSVLISKGFNFKKTNAGNVYSKIKMKHDDDQYGFIDETTGQPTTNVSSTKPLDD